MRLDSSDLSNPFQIEVKGTTKITGIFGDPLTYTLSPKMQNYCFSRLKLDFVYIPFVVKPDRLKSAVEAVKALNFAGVNVTIPHKEGVLPFLDELTPLAKKIGAVNTICNIKGNLIGDNTDASGFIGALKQEGFDPEKKSVVLLGSGGAARAISVGLLENKIKKLTVINRTLERGKALADNLRYFFPKNEILTAPLNSASLKRELNGCDLLVNATPAGLEGVELAEPLEKILSSNTFVFDTVYAKTTPLLSAAQRSGIRSAGGIGMLAAQGALAFSLWTGKEPPFELMREALLHD